MSFDIQKYIATEDDDDWSQFEGPIAFTPEQTIDWLEGMRELMFEVYKNNPNIKPKHLDDPAVE